MNRLISCLFFSIFLLNCYASHSQEYGITWGEEFPLKKNAASPQIIGNIKQKVFVLKSDASKTVISYYIDVYDESTLRSINRISFKNILPSDMRSHSISKMMLIGEQLLLFSLSADGNLYASVIGFDWTLIRGKIQLDNFGQKGSDFDNCIIAISPDDDKILIMREIDGKKKDNVEYSFILYDTAFNQLVSKKEVLPYLKNQFSLVASSILIDNSGNAYFVGHVKLNEAMVNYQKINTYKFVLMSFTLGSGEPEFNEINIPLDEKVGISCLIYLDNKKLNISGLYASGKDAQFLDGIFHLQLDKNSYRILDQTYTPFPNGSVKPSIFYRLKNLFYTGNGDKILVMESTIDHTFKESASYFIKYLCTQNIMVVRMDKQDSIIWSTVIEKNQYVYLLEKALVSMIPIRYKIQKYEDLLSYICILTNKNLHFIFNDDVTTFSLYRTEKTPAESNCSAVTLNLEEGEWEKKVLFSNGETNTFISPGNSQQISDSEIITFSFKKGTCRIGKIKAD